MENSICNSINVCTLGIVIGAVSMYACYTFDSKVLLVILIVIFLAYLYYNGSFVWVLKKPSCVEETTSSDAFQKILKEIHEMSDNDNDNEEDDEEDESNKDKKATSRKRTNDFENITATRCAKIARQRKGSSGNLSKKVSSVIEDKVSEKNSDVKIKPTEVGSDSELYTCKLSSKQ